jgi:predicted nucleic acid-binding protein
MTVERTAILIDTNVLVYAYDPSDVAKQQRAQQVIQFVGDGVGALSVQVLGEFYWTVTRRIQPPISAERAARSVENYLRSWPVLDLTRAVVAEAVLGAGRLQLPYWDALIWATAKLNQVPLVLSEDFADGAFLEGVRFMNPFSPTFVRFLEGGASGGHD